MSTDLQIIPIANPKESTDLRDFSRFQCRDAYSPVLKLLDSIPTLVIAFDHEGRLTFWNRTCQQVTGYTAEKAEHQPEIVKTLLGLRSTQSDCPVSIELIDSNGEGRYIEWKQQSSEYIVPGLSNIWFGSDQTKLHESQISSKRNQERLDRILQNTPGVAVQWYDRSGCVLTWNSGSESLFGYTAAEAVGKQLNQLIFAVEENELFLQLLNKIDQTEKAEGPLEFQFRHKSGQIGYCLSTIFPIPMGDDQARYVCMDIDITHRKGVEEQLLANEQRQHLLNELISDVITLHDLDGTIQFITPSIEPMTGWSIADLHGNQFSMMHPDDQVTFVQQTLPALNRGEAQQTTWRLRRKDGRYIWLESYNRVIFDHNKKPLQWLSCTRDISDRKRLEQERQILDARLFRAEKLQSLSVMAGGIAHDFNNLFTAILGNAELLEAEVNPNSDSKILLQQIQIATMKAATLTKQMLAYSGKENLLLQPVSISRMLEQIEVEFRPTLLPKTVFQSLIHPQLPPVLGDVSQIRQVLLNLLHNARESLPSDGSGKIEIEAIEQFLASEQIHDLRLQPATLKPGHYIRIAVRDSGSGIHVDLHEKIFEPFYTTKFPGRGLGLAAVLGAVRAMRGAVEVQSTAGEGSLFQVYLPTKTMDSFYSPT
jgi:two-component system, cell cycle sensor histidine kinase and response regulator CckA